MAIFIHRLALCESEQVGDGTRIWAFAHVMAGAVIGRDCNICDHTHIGSLAVIGNRVTVKNMALVGDGVSVADDVFVGPCVIFTNDQYPRSPRMPSVAPRYADPDRWRVGNRVERRHVGNRRGDSAGSDHRPLRDGRGRSDRDSRRAAASAGGRQSGPARRLGLRLRTPDRGGPGLHVLRRYGRA